MTFFSIVTRNLTRRPVRTALTLLGISMGIAAVVALVGIARGFQKSWDSGLQARGTDIVVSNMGGALTPKSFDEEVRDKIAVLEHVKDTCPLLVEFMNLNGHMVMVSAREWGGFTWDNLRLTSGRMPKDAKEEALILGKTAADVLGKKIGEKIKLGDRELEIVGIVDGGALVEDGSAVLSLELFQEMTGAPGKINVIDVSVTSDADDAETKALCEKINALLPEGRAMIASEHLNESQGYQMIKGMSWGTSLLAVVVGVFGVMNTMLMTVFERTQEICVLLALGWKRNRIVRMIIMEAALLGGLGGLFGVAIGVIGVKLLQQAPAIRGLLEPDLSPGLILISIGISIAVGVLSGLYPAWRSSRLQPSQALNG